jgi:biotin carboxyl carrier protein
MKEFINQTDNSNWAVGVIGTTSGYSAIKIEVDGEQLDLQDWRISIGSSSDEVVLERGYGEERLVLVKVGDIWWVYHNGHTSRVCVVERGAVSTFDSMGGLTSPMPGKILNVMASIGEPVDKGQTLLILEAMKMENRICSPVDGIVSAIHYEAGDQVNQGAILIEIEEAE